jgi:hypothetical protein
MGVEGARTLAGVLSHVPRLTTLNLGGNSINSIGVDGAHSLAGALSHVPQLTTLIVLRHPLCARGAIALASALSHTCQTSRSVWCTTTPSAKGVHMRWQIPVAHAAGCDARRGRKQDCRRPQACAACSTASQGKLQSQAAMHLNQCLRRRLRGATSLPSAADGKANAMETRV